MNHNFFGGALTLTLEAMLAWLKHSCCVERSVLILGIGELNNFACFCLKPGYILPALNNFDMENTKVEGLGLSLPPLE